MITGVDIFMTGFTDTIKIDNYDGFKEGIYFYKNMKIQIIEEKKGNNYSDAHNIYKGKRIFNNRNELWDATAHKFK